MSNIYNNYFTPYAYAMYNTPSVEPPRDADQSSVVQRGDSTGSKSAKSAVSAQSSLPMDRAGLTGVPRELRQQWGARPRARSPMMPGLLGPSSSSATIATSDLCAKTQQERNLSGTPNEQPHPPSSLDCVAPASSYSAPPFD